MSNYCTDISIPVAHPLSDPGVLNQTGADPEIWYASPDQVSKEFTDWLDSIGLVMTYPPLMFYTPAGKQCGIHVDGYSITNRATVNWIVAGDNDLMHWYDLTVEFKDQTNSTQAGTPYVYYEPHEVNLIHSQKVNWPSIVKVGIPHNITNFGSKPRWCISCDLSTKENPEAGLEYEQALEIFKKWIL